MKFFVIALSLFVVAAAAPTIPDAALEARRRLPALEQEEIHDEFGQFALRYETAEGIVVSERGRLVPTLDGTDYVMIFEGEVSYIGDDGQTYVTKYTAGLDGTHVEGNHLPVPVTAQPLNIVAEPVEGVSEPFRILEKPLKFVAKPIKVIEEPFKAINEPVKIVEENH